MSKEKTPADEKSAQKIKYRHATLAVSLLETNSGQIEGLPRNPRLIKGDKFKALRKSVGDDPDMMEIRPVVVVPKQKTTHNFERMKKIMFNDKFGLTDAVLQGRKTITRRIVPIKEAKRLDSFFNGVNWYYAKQACIDDSAAYMIGEVVAVAQSYEDLGYSKEWVEQHVAPNPNAKPTDPFEKKYPGWTNKMFVRADPMPHQIKITEIKVERLQDISDEDCMREGITMMTEGKIEIGNGYGWDTKIDALKRESFFTPKAAFAALIDKVSGKGTWEKNPWVFCYSFVLVK